MLTAPLPAELRVPDLDRARRFVAARPPPGHVVLCSMTSSHFYEFPSPDSDV
ncbi:MAG: hypothetical protein IT378_27355, partial [Sandaracinaceae bacterium]|nr:hypothetical protein [Sandaracinaceae bacterium]